MPFLHQRNGILLLNCSGTRNKRKRRGRRFVQIPSCGYRVPFVSGKLHDLASRLSGRVQEAPALFLSWLKAWEKHGPALFIAVQVSVFLFFTPFLLISAPFIFIYGISAACL